MSTCPAVGCTVETGRGMFMCRPHWFGLPKPIRDRVWECWRAYQNGGGSEALLDHAVICDEAIRLTAEKEGKPPPTEAQQRAPRMRRIMGDRA